MNSESEQLTIGVLALQGAVEEHMDAVKAAGANAVKIRVPADFDNVNGIILPGGESTTMSIVAEPDGLFPKLQEWIQSSKPIWGTCAGMILLSDHAIKKSCGQSLVGGLDVYVCRNYFGSQIHSCIRDVAAPEEIRSGDLDESPIFPAVFIRAPAILKAGPSVQVLSRIDASPHISAREDVDRLLLELFPSASDDGVDKISDSEIKMKKKRFDDGATVNSDNIDSHEVIIAVKRDNILATSFHPELTPDLRWHK